MPSNVITNQKSNYAFIFRIYRPMLIVLLLCGFHFEFYKRNFALKIFAKSYCLCTVTLVLFSSIACCDIAGFSHIWSLIEYIVSVLILLCYNSRVQLFFSKISKIDSYLRINRYHYNCTARKILALISTAWCLRVAYTVLFCICHKCYNNFLLYFVTQISLFALDLNRSWRCILFDAIRYRLKMLRMRLEESPGCSFYLYVKNDKSVQENKLKFCLYLYRKIADMIDNVSPELFTSLLISLGCSLPKMILDIYNILTVIEGSEPPATLGFVVIHVLQVTLLLFTPFVAMEMYAMEGERMRLFLMHNLIQNPYDQETREGIEMFLRYTEIRGFRYKIWRTIPINITLPLEMINVCITYVIVVINFTHLYG